ncbi:hypothetical protein IQ07DRAFT_406524 [Pyrenochaeta sp. DS3sAY3a]|nr:hypothetical protein IQ07DRAFT_406524 [Pyrenochaeta sp. DS3sAY3a]
MASSSGAYNAARPKRAGEQFTRTHRLDGDDAAKKPRFDPRNPSMLAPDAEDDHDADLEADVIGKGTAGVKRNAVNIDGYDSDSSTENFNTRAQARGGRQEKPAKDDDDDDDMFAEEDEDNDEDDDAGKDLLKKKKPRFLDDHEIEGQDDTSKSAGHIAANFAKDPKGEADDADDSGSSSGDDEERDRLDPNMDKELGAGSKKRNAPRIDAFNMRSEQEEGRFDEAGNYVRTAFDPHAIHDSWLQGISKKDMKKAKAAQEKMNADLKARERAEDAIITSEVLSELIALLVAGETPMEALMRYGKITAKQNNNAAKKKKSQAMDVDVDPAKEAAVAKAKAAIDSITECASRLSRRIGEDPYDLAREMLMRQYKGETGEDWKNPSPEKSEWEFRWLAAGEDDINGPYDQATMQQWDESGQFAAGAEFRRVGEWEWSRLLDFET